jgi:hypothetical protein
MAEKMRYNKIIDLLEHGKPVFSTSTVPNGSLDDLTYIADADYDAVIVAAISPGEGDPGPTRRHQRRKVSAHGTQDGSERRCHRRPSLLIAAP